MSNANWTKNEIDKLDTLTVRLKNVANDSLLAANDLICAIEKSNGKIKKALCKPKKKVH